MTKTELVKAIATTTGKTQKDVAEFVDAFTGAVTDSLAKGEDVALVGFGSFKVSEVAERTARNPQTGENIVVPKHNRVSFKVGSKLKLAVK